MSTEFDSDSYSKTLFDGLPEFLPGWVWLVGGGPGDRGLLTLHAVNAIRQADAIVYDALVDEAILSFARPDILVEFAGKRGGRPSHKTGRHNPALDCLGQGRQARPPVEGRRPLHFRARWRRGFGTGRG